MNINGNYADYISDTPRFIGLKESMNSGEMMKLLPPKEDLTHLKEQIFGRQELWNKRR